MIRLLTLGTLFFGLPGVAAAGDAFPEEMQGFWTGTEATCQTLKTEGPAYVGANDVWLRVTKTDVLGTTQGRFLQEEKPMMVDMSAAKFSVTVQTIDPEPRLIDLTVSVDGKLFETIVGARASLIYVPCH